MADEQCRFFNGQFGSCDRPKHIANSQGMEMLRRAFRDGRNPYGNEIGRMILWLENEANRKPSKASDWGHSITHCNASQAGPGVDVDGDKAPQLQNLPLVERQTRCDGYMPIRLDPDYQPPVWATEVYDESADKILRSASLATPNILFLPAPKQ